MAAPYDTDHDLNSPSRGPVSLYAFASTLSGSRLNPLVLMSDPARTPDILTLADAMPPRSAIIYRHFGSPGQETALREITARKNIQFLIGNDPGLARDCGADGVHFSRATPNSEFARWRKAEPKWIISAASRKSHPDPRAFDTIDALFISSIFSSDSPSAGTAIGVEALDRLSALYPCPVFALGGINRRTVAALRGCNIVGIAAIGGLAEQLRMNTMTQSDEKPDGHVTITKQEGGEMIIFNADVAGSSATGELTLRRVSDGVWNANHTGVPKAIGGRGVGKALVAAMVEDARQTGYRVIPGCPFVARLFERKPEWAEGVAA